MPLFIVEPADGMSAPTLGISVTRLGSQCGHQIHASFRSMRDVAGAYGTDRCWQYLGSDTDPVFDTALSASLLDPMAFYLFAIKLPSLLRRSVQRYLSR